MKSDNNNQFITRLVKLIIGLFFSGIGVAITRNGALGVSPISSVANVIGIRYTFFSFGTWLLIWNCMMILGQAIVLKKDFKLYQLLQIPLSVLFGWFTDFGVWLAAFVSNDIYIVRIASVLLGTVVLGFGIALTVSANLIMNSGEAFVKAIADKTGIVFGNVKIGFDISCVILSVILSLILFDFRIVGTREGTIIAALCTGLAVKFFQKMLFKEILEA